MNPTRVRRQGQQHAIARIDRREEHAIEDERGCRGEDEEVVPLDDRTDGARDE